MLTEEAFHMQTGENGIGRIVKRAADLVAEGTDPRAVGAIPFDLIQRYVNYWASASMDLFGSEDSTNASEFFAMGLKGRYREGDGIYKDPRALEHVYKTEVPEGDHLVETEIPLRRAMNALLLDAYVADCRRIVDRWNRELKRAEVDFRITLPSQRFNRRQGIYSGHHFAPEGNVISADEWQQHQDDWLPTDADRDYVKSCMVKVHEVGKIANWIAPPARGVNDQPFEYEYVKFH